jgi:hypothetical protein
MTIDWKKLLPVGAAIALFFVLTLAYFSPVMEGKRLIQGDIRNHAGMSHDIAEHRDAYGEEPLWAGSMFSGMPAYQVSVVWPGSALHWLDRLFHGFLPRPADFVFLYLIGMFIGLRCIRVDPWLSLVGALAFAFSSYFFVILEAGHNSKANAVGYMPLVLGGLYMLLRGNKLLGAALFALFLSLLVYVNHVQVAYYLGMLLVLFGLAEAWRAIGEKRIGDFLQRGSLALVGVVFALLTNAGMLWSTYEYGKYTTRGPSELTIEPGGGDASANKTSGLDRDYVTNWSYGKQESFSLIVPHAKGGASGSVIKSQEDINAIADPAFRSEVLKKYQDGGYINSYWGDQDFTSGPVYLGIVVVLLMLLLLSRAEGMARWWVLGSLLVMGVLLNVTSPLLAGGLVIAYLLAGIFLWKDTLAYALFSALLLTLFLSWGKFCMPLTDFFLDHVPGYDKFRAVTIILVIVELCAPVLAVLYLDSLLKEDKWDRMAQRRFLIPAAGLLLVLLVMAVGASSLFDFFSDREKEQLTDGSQAYVDGLKAMRLGIFTGDVWRGIGFLVVGAGLVFAFGRRIIGKPLLLAGLGLVILFDLWTVDKRYLNNEKPDGRYLSWEDDAQSKLPFKPQPADLAILQREQTADTEADLAQALERMKEAKRKGNASNKLVSKDEEALARFGSLRRTTNFRVLNLRDPFNDSRVSYFHKSIGGYHGAKLKRYQELISFHLGPEMQDLLGNLRGARSQAAMDSAFLGHPALNMLNMRYLIVQPDQPPLHNPHALGDGWFVDEVRTVKNADEEITSLGTVDPERVALVDERFTKDIDVSAAKPDRTASVSLKGAWRLNDMRYTVKSANGGVVVFSEIWYGPDWYAEIDGQPAPYGRADYVLRAMNVPAGEHEVRFYIKSKPFSTGGQLASVSSWVLLLVVLGAIGMSLRKNASGTVEPRDGE